jgi:hypothetical protein
MDAAEQNLIDSMRADYQALITEIVDANQDLKERLIGSRLDVVYDSEEDMFFITIGDRVEALTETVNNTILLRYDPDTLKIVGIGAMGVKSNVPEASKVRKMYHLVLDAPGEVADVVRELVGT